MLGTVNENLLIIDVLGIVKAKHCHLSGIRLLNNAIHNSKICAVPQLLLLLAAPVAVRIVVIITTLTGRLVKKHVILPVAGMI